MILPYYSEGEKRNFNRVKVDVAAQLQVGNGNRNLTGMCCDLSGGGMLIELDNTVSVGTSVEVIIKSKEKNGPVLHAETTVARILSSPEQNQKCLLGLKIDKVLN